MNRIIRPGDQSGQWTVTGFPVILKSSFDGKYELIAYPCICLCGKEKLILQESIHLKNKTPFTCSHRACLSESIEKYGLEVKRLYQSWYSMNYRCYNKKCSGYHSYGGRGILVCQEWYWSFDLFYKWAMSHGYRDTLTIDRIDNNGNYEPDNCQWVTKSENSKKLWIKKNNV